MNPAMSSWLALRLRTQIQPGQSVFVLGATGNAGRMAIQIAKLLGAGRVVGAGREISRLESSAADESVSLVGNRELVTQAIAKAASDVDIVLDYLWGQPALDAMTALLSARRDRSGAIDWIQLGSVAGPTMALPSAALRSTPDGQRPRLGSDERHFSGAATSCERDRCRAHSGRRGARAVVARRRSVERDGAGRSSRRTRALKGCDLPAQPAPCLPPS